MSEGLTLQQLQSMGAKPVGPAANSGGLTLAQLQAQGAKPVSAIPTTPTPAPNTGGLLGTVGKVGSAVSNVIQSIFPGQKLGQDIGTLVGYGYTALKEKLGLVPKGTTADYDLSAPTPLQAVGDAGQAALTILAPEVGKGASVIGRIAANTGLGASLGATSAIADKSSIGDVAKSTLEGGAIGGITSVVGEGLKELTNNLPKWLTKLALPKLDTSGIPYALKDSTVGSLDTLQTHSNNAIHNYENSIQTILHQPEYTGVAADTGNITNDALKQFPNSQYTKEDLINNAHSIAPKVSNLIQKFDAGQANVGEINTIRKELDSGTKSVYTSLNRPPESKMLGAALANSMRNYVQKTAPETEPIFKNYAKEVGLNKAIAATIKAGQRKIKLGDIAAGAGGYAEGGLSGALKAIIAERVLRNPAAQLAGAKIIEKTGQSIVPVAEKIFQGLKAPIINSVVKSN